MKFYEATLHESSELKIDREAGVIRDVKVLGKSSKNGKTYSDKALDDAVRVFEGAEVNIDHDKKNPTSRPFGDGWGVLSGVYRDGDEVFAKELSYLKSHPQTEVLLERAERFPRKFGLSIAAEGKTNRKGSSLIVESIDKGFSVDLVRGPATTNTLFESEDIMPKTVTKTFKEIVGRAFPKTWKTAKLWEMEEGALAAMPVEVPEDASSEDQIWAAFKQAIMAAVDDDGLDIKATLKKVGEILKAYEKLTSASGSEKKDPPASEGGSEPVAESEVVTINPKLEKLFEKFDRLERRDLARTLAEEAGVKMTTKLFESLMDADDENEMRRIIERAKPEEQGLGGARRGTRKPLFESASGDDAGAYPEDVKSFARSVKM